MSSLVQCFVSIQAAAAESTYYLRHILPDNALNNPPQMDGPTLIPYNGDLFLMFGWLGELQSNKIWRSTDNGQTFTADPDAPFASAEQKIALRNDGKLWVWATTNNEIYNYDGSWHYVNNNCPSPYGNLKVLFNDKMIIFGGQLATGITPVIATNVYRYNDNTGNWDVIGQTPNDVWLCVGTAWVDGAYIYATGGGKINNFDGTYEFLNDKIIRSADGGVTWSVYATLPSGMRAMWPATCKYNGKIWYLNGYSSGANQVGLWKSSNNGQSWTLVTSDIPGRHATPMCVYDDSLYVGWGNFHNDLFRIEKIEYPIQGFVVPQVQNWWEKLWPADRPTDSLLTAVNTLFNTLNTDLSLNPAKTQLQVLDFFALVAGVENENQFLIPLVSSNLSYFNKTTKVNGNPNWTTNGASSTLGGGNPVYLLNWVPSSNGVNFVTNSASMFEYTLADVTDDFYEFGNPLSYILGHSSDNGGRFYGTINSTDFAVEGITSGKGYKGISRLSSTNVDVTINTTHTAITKNSGSIGGTKFSVCGLENAGSTYGSIHVFAAVGVGSGDLDHDKMKITIETFLVATGIIPPITSVSVSHLIVAGGGGGGRETGSGGGGGGYREGTSLVMAGGIGRSYQVIVGAGGTAGTGGGYDAGTGGDGGNSSFNSIIALGGAGGVGGGLNGQNGGCGSGASRGGTSGGTGSQGGNGGSGGASSGGDIASAGGGGGAGGNGGNGGTGVGGAGGIGHSSSISGSSQFYGGGGGGSVYYVGGSVGGAGGTGGGGAGGTGTGSNGTANTGGGGGGGALQNIHAFDGGSGGSGIVILSYPTGSLTATGGTITTSGGNTIHTFTSSGYFVVS